MSTSTTPLRMGTTEWLLLALLSVLWGGSFLFIKVAVAEIPPLVLVLARVTIAAMILQTVVRLCGLSMNVGRPVWISFFGMGVLNNLIPFSLIFWGQAQIQVGLASILNATTPLFGVIVAHLLTQDEKATPQKVAGVMAGIGGVMILMGPDAISGLGSNLLPQLACLGAAVSYAFSSVYGRRFRALPPLVTATGQLSTTTLVMIPVVAIFSPPWHLPMPSAPVIWSVIGLSTISTALAYAIFFRIMKTAGGSNVNLATFLIPPSAILLGAIVLSEAMLPRHFAGMAAIFVGLALIDGRILKLLKR
jgi:drug/metabolite transporter (DMT)-like permease